MPSDAVCRCDPAVVNASRGATDSTCPVCGLTRRAAPGPGGRADDAFGVSDSAAPPPLPEPAAATTSASPTELVPPTQLVFEDGGASGSPARGIVMAALADDGLWVQSMADPLTLRHVALGGGVLTHAPARREVTISFGEDAPRAPLALRFIRSADETRWHAALAEWLGHPPRHPAQARSPSAGSVCLKGDGAGMAWEEIGPVEALGTDDHVAEAALQLRAAMEGADAVVGVRHEQAQGRPSSSRRVYGLAVRAADDTARQRVRNAWYAEQVGRLVGRSLLLLALLVAMDAIGQFVLGSFTAATIDRTPLEILGDWASGLSWWIGWPAALALFLGWSRWPGFLRPLAIALFTAAVLRTLVSMLTLVAAVLVTGSGRGMLGRLLDPFEWAVVFFGLKLASQAWRMAPLAARIAGPDGPSTERRSSFVPTALSLIHAVAVVSFVAPASYELHAYLVQPGVDPRREAEASLALERGLAALEKGDYDDAETNLQRSLASWQRLTGRPAVPLAYHAQLGCTLNNLGCVRVALGRPDEAEEYFKKCLKLGETVAGGGPDDADFRRILDYARTALEQLHDDSATDSLAEKDREASRAYERGVVAFGDDPAESKRLFAEAVAAWEEILSEAVHDDHREVAVRRLSSAYNKLAEAEDALGNRVAAEAALGKAEAFLERLTESDPDSPIHAHNLDVTRTRLDATRAAAVDDEVSRLLSEERFADAIARCRRDVDELEARLSTGGDSTIGRLASRLDRLAWLLAHCPDEAQRDPKASIAPARRATELRPDLAGPWFTLAVVLHRAGDWSGSLDALGEVKRREGDFDAADWFLSAMNLHRLQRPDEARTAMRNGEEWLIDAKRRAEQNPILRLGLEVSLELIESLRQEAADLLEGKDVAWTGVGPFSFDAPCPRRLPGPWAPPHGADPLAPS